MPKWMEPYRDSIVNTGGNSVEDLMNWKGSIATNLPLATLSIAVGSQVSLLYRLRDVGRVEDIGRLVRRWQVAILKEARKKLSECRSGDEDAALFAMISALEAQGGEK